MVERRDVELLIRAKDLSTKPLRDVRRSLDEISESLGKQVEAARRGEISYQELSASFKQVEQAGRALGQTQGAIDRFNKLSAESAQLADRVREASISLRDYKASLEGSENVTKRQETEVRKLEAAYERARKAFEKNSTQIEAQRQTLTEAGVETNNLAQEQQRLVSTAQQAGQAATVLSTAMQGYAQNAREAAQATKAARDLDAFRGLATQAEEAIGAARRLATATGQIRGEAGTFAASIRSIADPAGEARRSLSGLEAQVEDLSTTVAAINGPVRNYSETLLQLTAAQRAATNTATLIDRFQQQTDALRQARVQFSASVADLRRLEQAFASATEPSEELKRELAQAAATAQNAGRQYNTLVRAARDTREELRAAGVDTRNLTDAQVRLEAAVRRSTDSVQRLQTAFAINGSAGTGGVGVFGLSPYQVQNLGFQINDFFTQIASGTSISQAFAQQIGQVVQVFGPGAWSGLTRLIPQLVLFGATLGVLAASISRLVSTSAALREFNGLIAVTASGGTTGATAQGLTAIAREAQNLGFSFEEARKVVAEFFRQGLNQDRIRQIIPAVRGLALAQGIEGAEAAKLFTDAIRGSWEEISRLDDRLQFLTVAQRQSIFELFRSGEAARAQQTALQALENQYRGAATIIESDFVRSLREARVAFLSVADEIANGAVGRAALALLNQLASGARALAAGLRQARGEAAQELTPAQQLALRRQVIQQGIDGAERRIAEGDGFLGINRERVEESRRNLQSLREELGRITQQEEDLAEAERSRVRTGSQQNDERRLQRGREFIAQQQQELAIVGARTEAERKRLEVEREGRQAVERATAAGVSDRDQLAEIRRNAEAAELAKQAREAANSSGSAAAAVRRDFQAIQQDLLNTVRVRDETIRGIQEDVASGALTPAEAIGRIQAAADQARPALQRLAEEARRFRDSQSGGDAVRRAALDSLVAQAERQAGAGGTRQGVGAVLQSQQQELQRLIQERQQFVQTQNALQQQGVVSVTDSEQRIRDFYANTNDELVRQIDLLRQAAEAARANGSISEAAFAQINGQLELYTANLQRVDPLVAQLRNNIESGFTNAFTTAFNSVAESLGGLIAGTKSLSDAFDDAGRASLQFFADFLKAIGQAILQQQALIVAKTISAAISGVFHSGGVVGAPGGVTRAVSPAWFANAPRYHSGGIAGLRSDEVPAILQRGEEVLARDDPRNILNGGGSRQGGGGPTSIRAVFAVGESEIANAMATEPGERVIIETLRRNAPTIKQMLR